jgi:hypothetical protein
MKKPKFPIGSLVREGDSGPFCPECDSSLKYRIWWLLLKSKYCIQPECENYWEKYKK